MLIEYPDPEERKRELAKLRDVEHQVQIEIDGCERISAIADEDMARSNDEKTSAVHFLRFELPAEARAEVRSGANISVVIEHPAYHARASLSDATRKTLAADLSTD